MASVSGVQIANEALMLIGAKRISSLEDEVEGARRCSVLLDQARELVLASHPWACALKRANLSASSTSPAFDWDYQYPLPGDCLVPYELREQRPGYGGYTWKQEGYYVMTDAATCHLIYIYNLENYPRMHPHVRAALAALLAHRLTYVATTKKTKVEESWNYFIYTLEDAIAKDSRIGSPDIARKPGDLEQTTTKVKSWVEER